MGKIRFRRLALSILVAFTGCGALFFSANYGNVSLSANASSTTTHDYIGVWFQDESQFERNAPSVHIWDIEYVDNSGYVYHSSNGIDTSYVSSLSGNDTSSLPKDGVSLDIKSKWLEDYNGDWFKHWFLRLPWYIKSCKIQPYWSTYYLNDTTLESGHIYACYIYWDSGGNKKAASWNGTKDSFTKSGSSEVTHTNYSDFKSVNTYSISSSISNGTLRIENGVKSGSNYIEQSRINFDVSANDGYEKPSSVSIGTSSLNIPFTGYNVTKDITVNGSCSGEQHQITLLDNGGSGGSGTVNVTYGSAIPNVNVPTKTGYDFGGYYNGDTQIFDKDGKAVQSTSNYRSDFTATAKWTEKEYAISFNKGDGSGTMESASKKYFSNYTIPNSTFTPPTDKQFSYWQGSDGESYSPGDTYTTNAALTLTAIYSDITTTYVMSFNCGDGTGTMGNRTKNYNVAFTLPDSTFTPQTGYVFDHWLGEDGISYNAGASYTTNADCEFTAIYVLGTYTLSFDTDGGSTIPSVDYQYGDTITPPADPTKSGFDFDGCDDRIWRKWIGCFGRDKERVSGD